MVRQSRAVATRQQIIRGAAETFDKTGYEGASLGDIVQRAGITKGALYFHFQSKDDLGRKVIDEQHALSIAAVTAIGEVENPAIEQIVMLCHEMARQIVTEPIVRAGIRLTLEMSAVGTPREPYVDWMNACQALIKRGQEQGELVDSLDAEQLAYYIISSFTGLQMVSNVLTGRADLTERVDYMWQLLLPQMLTPSYLDQIDTIRAARYRGH